MASTARTMELPGRGTTFVRELPGPAGAPVLLLLHGLTATADLNWLHSYRALARRFRVIALDHRGHGRGVRSNAPFELEACADDAAAVLRQLGIHRVVAVGYSMGGPVAQLLWRRHPELVEGLVLCATTDHFVESARERLLSAVVPIAPVISRHLSAGNRARLVRTATRRPRGEGPMVDLTLDAAARHDWTAICEAAVAVARFDARPWITEVDVPTAVVVTTDDQVVPPSRQARLGASVAGATVHAVGAGHDVCINDPDVFVPALLDACRSVANRAHRLELVAA
jgi:pimeloyl-ACP methyl ester carboxylesterase